MTASHSADAGAARADPNVRRWIARHLATVPPRAPSLIITVWGDAIAPHGGAVLLPGLIRLLAPFGINERLVRTSLFRLSALGWLQAVPVGRRSLYALTVDGARRTADAHRRIYAAADPVWDEQWELVLADGLALSERRALAAELGWAGFGTFGPGVFARPARAGAPVAPSLRALGVDDRVAVMRAADETTAGGRTLASAAPVAWDLAGVAARYRELSRRFDSLRERLHRQHADERDPEQCFVARTLLIHAYRRALLRDPQLPPALLPPDWPGTAAFALCGDVYRLACAAAERHLLATLEAATGPLPPADPEFIQRFGGLADSAGRTRARV